MEYKVKKLETYLLEYVQKGDSILIKGTNGTGKTTLAEELYDAIEDKRDVVLMDEIRTHKDAELAVKLLEEGTQVIGTVFSRGSKSHDLFDKYTVTMFDVEARVNRYDYEEVKYDIDYLKINK